MNSFFGYAVVEKLKFTIFDHEKKTFLEINDHNENVTNKIYQKKIDNVKNEKIRKSLLELTRVFKEK